MPLTITITQEDGPSITRQTLDVGHVRELLGADRPAWLASRGRQGGPHNLETCESCAAAAAVRAFRAEEWQAQDATYRAETERLMAGMSHSQRLSSPEDRVSDTEHTALVTRQYRRILKLAKHCPERRIPVLHKAYRVQSAFLRKGNLAQRALGTIYSVGADIMWSRWMDARDRPGEPKYIVARHGESTPGRILVDSLDHVDHQAMTRNSVGEWSND